MKPTTHSQSGAEPPASEPTLSHRGLGSSALVQLTMARLREFYRQPEAVFWVYLFPLLMIVALGIAFRNRPVERIRVDVIEGKSAETIRQMLADDERIVDSIQPREAARQRLRTDKTDVVIDPSAADESPSPDEQSTAPTVPRIEYHFDPTRPGSVVARDSVDKLLQAAAGRVDAIETTSREVDEPGGRYIDFLVPGLLGMGLMGGGLFGVAFAIVDLRIRKLLKRFLATPMKKSQFLIGIMASRMLFMIPEMVLLLVFARFVFGVVVHGNWGAVIFLIVLGAVEFSGVGMLVASRVKTLESASGLMNLVMLPMWMLSGIFFSYERFPAALHPFIKALPLTPLNDALRAVMLEGQSLASQWPEISIMTAWTVFTFAVALWIFRWHD
jgi:ABC-type multidrug transport system permease subunit